MNRARLAVIGLAITAAGVTPGVSQAAKFHYTNRVSVSGQLTDHWTGDPGSASYSDDLIRTVTVTFTRL